MGKANLYLGIENSAMKGRLNDAKDFFKKAQNCKSDNDERPEINDGLGYSHHAL